MNNNKETWFKWDYVCPDCDSHIEMTAKSDGHSHDSYCLKCAGDLVLMSVLDATIYPTTKKEETNMETLTPAPQIMTLNWIENDVETTKTYTENDVRGLLYRDKSYQTKMNEYYLKEQKLRTLLNDVFHDSEDQDTLEKIANIFDVPLTKEIEVTAWVNVQMTIEVDMREGEYDVEDLVRNNLTIDAYGGEINVNDFDVDRVEESY
jgi:Zn-finger nucleic acid-binding protein